MVTNGDDGEFYAPEQYPGEEFQRSTPREQNHMNTKAVQAEAFGAAGEPGTQTPPSASPEPGPETAPDEAGDSPPSPPRPRPTMFGEPAHAAPHEPPGPDDDDSGWAGVETPVDGDSPTQWTGDRGDLTGRRNKDRHDEDDRGAGHRVPHILGPGDTVARGVPGGAGYGTAGTDPDDGTEFDWGNVETPIGGAGERAGASQPGNVAGPARQIDSARGFITAAQRSLYEAGARLLQAKCHLSPPATWEDIETLARVHGVHIATKADLSGRRGQEYGELVEHDRGGDVAVPVTDASYLSTPQLYEIPEKSRPVNIGGFLATPGVRAPTRYSTGQRPGMKGTIKGAAERVGDAVRKKPGPANYRERPWERYQIGTVMGGARDLALGHRGPGTYDTDDDGLTIDQMAQGLKCHKMTVRRGVKAGRIAQPYYVTPEDGGKEAPRWRPEDLEEALAKQ